MFNNSKGFLFSLLGGLLSTRVSNALGAGSPQSAQLSVSAAMTLAASAAILVSSIIFACRQVVGYAFSNELDVVDYFTEMVPLLSISVILDTLHDTLSGLVLSFLYFSMHITLTQCSLKLCHKI